MTEESDTQPVASARVPARRPPIVPSLPIINDPTTVILTTPVLTALLLDTALGRCSIIELVIALVLEPVIVATVMTAFCWTRCTAATVFAMVAVEDSQTVEPNPDPCIRTLPDLEYTLASPCPTTVTLWDPVEAAFPTAALLNKGSMKLVGKSACVPICSSNVMMA